jgi:alanine racemase
MTERPKTPGEEGILRIRPTRAEISASALAHNFKVLQEAAGGMALIPVVKANAYGHGVKEVVPVLLREGARMLAVALVEEAMELRALGVDVPMLLLGLGGGYDGAWDLLLEQDLWPTLYRADHLEAFAAAARRRGKKAKFNLKVDTGMGRIGVLPGELDELLTVLGHLPELVLAGLSSHFANADLADPQVTEAQTKQFGELLEQIRARGHAPELAHLSNSAGIFALSDVWKRLGLNAVRPGVALYGLPPAPWMVDAKKLRPVMTWKTEIAHLKRVAAGTPVSYGGTWIAQRESLIASLPLGYADGYSRHHSNTGHVLVGGRKAPIAGRVCMDMVMVDVTDIPGVALGDEGVLMGTQGEERITAAQLAEWSHTIHYEVVCGVGSRVPRVTVE